MKDYKNVLALDFEMYNAMHYWSICWIGALLTDSDFHPLKKLDIKVNPDTRHKLVGGELSFPFRYSDLKVLPKFDVAAKPLFELLNGETLVLGHAVDNDIKMLMTACSHYSIECPSFDYLDTNAVYGAMKGNYAQIGLAHLAQIYGVEFEAHDPSEDARATLEIYKAMLKESGLSPKEATERFGIEVGRVKNGLVRKCTVRCMTTKAREHIDNYNAVFDAVSSFDGKRTEKTLICGKKISVDLKLMSVQNLSGLVKWIVQNGGEIVYDSDRADTVLTSQFIEGNKHVLRLKDFSVKYGVPMSVCDGLDFYPNKVTTSRGEALSFLQYLRNKYAVKKEGGKCFCFARAVEKDYFFEEIAVKLLKSGNRICTVPDKNTVFVVDTPERLSDNSDLKVRTYNRIQGQKRGTVTFGELKKMY